MLGKAATDDVTAGPRKLSAAEGSRRPKLKLMTSRPSKLMLAALRPLGKAVLGKAEGKFVQYT